jgi:hypothetical protein
LVCIIPGDVPSGARQPGPRGAKGPGRGVASRFAGVRRLVGRAAQPRPIRPQRARKVLRLAAGGAARLVGFAFGARPRIAVVRPVRRWRHGARLSRPRWRVPCGRVQGFLVEQLGFGVRILVLRPARSVRPTRRFCPIRGAGSIQRRLGRRLLFNVSFAAPAGAFAFRRRGLSAPCRDLRLDARAQLLLVAHRGTVTRPAGPAP